MFRFVLTILIIFSITVQAREFDSIEKVGQLYDYWKGSDASVQNDFAYIAASSGIKIIDLIDPDQPVLIGSWEDNATKIRCCIAQGDILYAVDDLGWLYVLNIEIPSTPNLISSILIDSTRQIQTTAGISYGNYLYLKWSRGLMTYDVSEPLNPRMISRLDDVHGDKMVIHNKRMYIGYRSDSDLYILSLESPDQPRIVYHQKDRHQLRDIAVNDEFLFVLYGRDGLVLFDLSIPDTLIESRVVNRFQKGYQLTLQDSIIWASCVYVDGSDSLFTLNIANPLDPEIIHSKFTDSHFTRPRVHYAGLGNSPFLLKLENGLRLYEISDPGNPLLRGTLSADSFPVQRCFINGDVGLAYGESHGIGRQIRIFDNRNPENPRHISSICNDSLISERIVYQNGYLYAALKEKGMAVFDLTSPEEPVLCNRLTENSCNDLVVRDNKLYSWSDELEVYDLTSGDSPHLSENYTGISQLKIQDDLLYGLKGDSMVVFDVSNLWEPIKQFSFNMGMINDFQLVGDFLFTLGYGQPSSIGARDISGAAPHKRVRFPNPYDRGWPCELGSDGEYLFIGLDVSVGPEPQYHSTLEVYDISDKENLLRIAWSQTEGSIRDIHEHNGYIYVAEEAHLGIYRMDTDQGDNPEYPPESFILQPIFPNPFNSFININYSIFVESRLKLHVYNIRGQLVNELFEGVMPAGENSVVWDAEGVSAGVYFVSMMDNSGNMKEMKKVVLLK